MLGCLMQVRGVWCLLPQTLQRELALLVALGQLYLVESILASSPYHRD